MNEKDFPLLNNRDVTYLDSACMSLRPKKVLNAVENYYRNLSSCPGRSGHRLSRETTEKIGEARYKVADLIDSKPQDLAFTSGTTEALNLTARAFGQEKVVLSDKEHNSNLVPWQDSKTEIIGTEGGLDFKQLENVVDEDTVVSLHHRSNIDGSELPLEKVSDIVHDNDGFLVVDAAQSVSHTPVSVKKLQPDVLAFSGHKTLGPTGTGVLYASDRVKDRFRKVKTGGGAVKNTTFRKADYHDFPKSVEAGLPNAAGIVGLGAAVDYLQDVGLRNIQEHEEMLSEKIRSMAEDVSGLEVLGDEGSGVFSFCFDGVGSHQVAEILDRKDVAVRSGRHCVHSWFNDRGVEPSFRASLHLYNNEEDVEDLFRVLNQVSVLN